MSRPQPVVATTTGQIHTDQCHTIDIVMRYDASDPFAAALTFRGKPWIVARSLLHDVLSSSSGQQIGDGDIQLMRIGDGSMTITLSSPTGYVEVLNVPARDLAAFLNATYVAVPMGEEAALINWDAYLDHVLSE